MRTFLAISVPDEVRMLAQETKEKIAAARVNIKWVEYENYHLTVKFLGDVTDEKVQQIRKLMQTVGDNCPAFQLRINGLGFFPNRFRPRIIWLGMGGELDKAQFLGNRVDNYLYELGFEPEKQHRFHLTLGRIRCDIDTAKTLERAAASKMNPISFTVDEFYLMESILRPEGPVYKRIDSFKLNG
ncbi:MAG TPA: RNA 2',3'-cyclic phosphodiesterase [Syntrophomonas sp.]|jgi:2'-5' RNA ligase|nr:RNA 2',3'-cyclic phosphodiesterase [Syntrophomonas sp.]HCF71707.1 RNA 2',3'-cyclic phosphodiesterase [Syntrophomonas sp.]